MIERKGKWQKHVKSDMTRRSAIVRNECEMTERENAMTGKNEIEVFDDKQNNRRMKHMIAWEYKVHRKKRTNITSNINYDLLPKSTQNQQVSETFYVKLAEKESKKAGGKKREKRKRVRR